MTKNTLEQRGFLFNKKWFDITSDGLSVRSKHLLDSSEYYVRFEDVGVKIIKSKSGNIAWLIAGFFLTGIAALLFVEELEGGEVEDNAYLFYLVAAVLCALTYLFTFKRVCYLAKNDNSNAIAFLIDKPSKSELLHFIEHIKEKRKSYLVEKYGHLTTMLPYEQQYQNLLWLNNVDALTHEEYKAKVDELNNLFQAFPGMDHIHLS
ncbi:hypothetical protein [Chitinophaga japonensis]|uniref:Uncharacterized protein n=1 Tax=Chitinophaga japonensis TaxID=104662 RepID=A0A562T7T6_CHIJA|nr:hypothetical protein [Chitinophaga japonensis]TWI88950.1 hypothetical protein LX66_3041 [Chitinophaga japonensis]